jgi:hypothetical protein
MQAILTENTAPRTAAVGRPRFKPTEGDRRRVLLLSALGFPQYKISQIFPITGKTLRKHFRHELNAARAGFWNQFFEFENAYSRPSEPTSR